MARIRVLEAIAGADFSWAPGDVVDLPDEEAAGWADGHRAVLLDDGQEPSGDAGPVMVHQEPLVIDEDGCELDVVAATIEDLGPPAGREDGPRWVRWRVVVRRPASPAEPGPDSGGQDGDSDEPQVQGDGPAPAAPFDPREHTNREVLAYLESVGYEEALRVLDIEANEGENRAGIGKNRDAVLEAARARDAAAGGGHAGAEKAADSSRGGGRGGQPETREW